MKPTRRLRRLSVAPALGLAALVGLAGPTVASAQDQPGGRFKVLVPGLEPQAGTKANVGRDIAEAVRKQLDELATHAPVDNREFRNALRQFKLKEDELTCVTSRQLAVAMNVELVMCGTVEQTGSELKVSARFIAAKSGEEFLVPEFTAPNVNSAADQIFTQFDDYQSHLRFAVNCNDYLQSQHWENALQNCTRALELNPLALSVMYMKSRALIELDSLEESLVVLDNVLEQNPMHGDALQTAGFVATKLNLQERALGYYNTYLELDPGNVDVRLKLASDLHRDGNPTGALTLLEQGLEQEPDHAVMTEYAGHFALAAAQKLDEQQPANGGSPRSAEAVAHYEKALGYYEKVFAEKGAEAESTMLANMLAALTQLDRYEDAVELGGRIIATKSDDASLWSIYANALQKVGRIDDALAALESAFAANPEAANIYSRRVLWLAQTGRFDDVRESFQQAVQRQEADPRQLALGILSYGYNEKFRKNQREESLPYLELTMELAPDPVTKGMAAYFAGFVWFDRGVAAAKPETAASAQRALPMFRRALELFEAARPYQQSEPSINLQQPIEQCRTFIEIQDALIKRGR